MKTLIAGLKWGARFLENRFPEKINLEHLATKDELAALRTSIANLTMEVEVLKTRYEEQKKQNEIIALRVGLSRPMQTVLRGVK
jgi:hypothetical protein